MTLAELQAWVKSAKPIEHSPRRVVDSSGNEDSFIIYEKDGLFYRIEFFNGYPCDNAWKGCPHGEYTPTPVRKASWMEYCHEWVE